MIITQYNGIKKLHIKYSETFWSQFENLLKNLSNDYSRFFFFIYSDENLDVLMKGNDFNKKINNFTKNKDYIFSLYQNDSITLKENHKETEELYKDLLHVSGNKVDLKNSISDIYSKFNFDKEISLPLLIQFKIDYGKVTEFANISYSKEVNNEFIINDLLYTFQNQKIDKTHQYLQCTIELIRFINTVLDTMNKIG